MSKTCHVSLGGRQFSARCGELLLDAALVNGVEIPYDCRSGHCGTCQVRLVAGQVFDGKLRGGEDDSIRACQCRIVSDLELAIEPTPEVTNLEGRVASLIRRAPDVYEVAIALNAPAHYLPGQYYRVSFRGYPERCYSPTLPLDSVRPDPEMLYFNIRQVPDGRVSSALGRRIRVGRRVRLVGPLGSAYLRPNAGRLILVAGGTGFAPIWSIAGASLTQRPERPIWLVAGARRLDSMYMIPALCRLARFPNVTLVPVVSEPQHVSRMVQHGHPNEFLPQLSPGDMVYAAGAPIMVEKIAQLARAAGVPCYADPFAPAAAGSPRLIDVAARWLGRARRPNDRPASTRRIASPPIRPIEPAARRAWTPPAAARRDPAFAPAP